MATNPVDPEQPPRIEDMFHRPLLDAAPERPTCARHPGTRPRRVLRAAWICPACVRATAADE
ncbi:hypothetical protein RM780_19200 [Streptomyces sp. DSM 44917]|uniref:Uncharacterized protein n=1 Tax=Streptomyces boetiae TaxID=3075541 RepID=A0ABU2LC70_9ACTN|nr:hypothetical protein [Streptomyces sp. DSM 44917]MDT0309071.1 hypothetical protein [Streptomyces sp. DSM 44917]